MRPERAAAGGPVVVDARHLRCPLPVIELAKAARGAAPGTLLTVLTTDPAARHDVPAWARLRGHTLVSVEQVPDGDVVAITHGDVVAITHGDVVAMPNSDVVAMPHSDVVAITVRTGS